MSAPVTCWKCGANVAGRYATANPPSCLDCLPDDQFFSLLRRIDPGKAELILYYRDRAMRGLPLFSDLARPRARMRQDAS